jgi:hypothetical protein
MFLLSLLIHFAMAYDWREETAEVIWVVQESDWRPRIQINEQIIAEKRAFEVLNHFILKGYEIVGHAMADHYERRYSWTLTKRRN